MFCVMARSVCRLCGGGRRMALIVAAAILSAVMMEGGARNIVVADSASRCPLPGASVFNAKGHAIGMSNAKGRLPFVSASDFPLTVRYLGYKERSVSDAACDTVFLAEAPTELAEVVFETGKTKMLHMLGYVREYSTLSTCTDTVFLFREKMVDYMLDPDGKSSFRGWRSPRILKTRSYYHFTDRFGLDSVSDESNNHFSWSDWTGPGLTAELPPALIRVESGTDTLQGKYSPSEIWSRNGDRVTVDVNVLADTAARKWVAELAGFFRKDLDFENLRVRYNYDNITAGQVSPADLTEYSFNIESNGRGHEMFKFNKKDEPFFVSTYAEVYILDKEYITVKEAKKWKNLNLAAAGLEILKHEDAPELQSAVAALIARVDNVDKERIRLGVTPNSNIGSRKEVNYSNYRIDKRALTLLKDLTGITSYKARRNFKRQWREFRESRRAAGKAQER